MTTSAPTSSASMTTAASGAAPVAAPPQAAAAQQPARAAGAAPPARAAPLERFGSDSIGRSKLVLLGDAHSCVPAGSSGSNNKKCVELLVREFASTPVESEVDPLQTFDIDTFASGDSASRPNYVQEYMAVYVVSLHDATTPTSLAQRRVQVQQMSVSGMARVAVLLLPEVIVAPAAVAAVAAAFAEMDGVQIIEPRDAAEANARPTEQRAVQFDATTDAGAAAWLSLVQPKIWHAAALSGYLSGGVRVHCWGDSLMSQSICNRMMRELLPHGDDDGAHRLCLPVLNYSSPRYQTAIHVREAVEQAYGSGTQDARGGRKHDYVVIYCGAADAASATDYKRVYSNVKLMVQAALEREQRIVLVGVPSRTDAGHDERHKNHHRINAALKRIAGDSGLALAQYVDTFSLLGEDAGHHVVRLQARYADADGVHLNEEGNRIVAQAVAEAVRHLFVTQLAVLPRTTLQDIERKYDMGDQIGKGGFGKVRVATNRHTGRRVAIKVIDKAEKINSAKQVVALHRELSIQASLKHPCIVELVEAFHTTEHVYIVMELCDGGDLHKPTARGDFKSNHGKLRRYFQHLISALRYLHAQAHVCHRDIKHANVILCTEGDVCKLTDFGLSKSLEAGDLSTYSGTRQYFAPELLSVAHENFVQNQGDRSALPVSTYTLAVDIWSCGIYLFCLLTAAYPFNSHEEILNRDKYPAGNFQFPAGTEEEHPAACALVRKMLVMDPRRRITIDEIFQDPWFKVDLESNPAAMSEGGALSGAGIVTSPVAWSPVAGGGAAAGVSSRAAPGPGFNDAAATPHPTSTSSVATGGRK